PRALPPHPCEQLTIAVDGGWERVEPLDDGARPVGTEPSVELEDLVFEEVAEEAFGLSAAQTDGILRIDRRPAHLHGVPHHRELHDSRFADFHLSHASTDRCLSALT